MSDWRNLTISVRWEIYYYVREWAARRDMSISAIVARFLENLPYREDYELPPPRKQRSNDAQPLTDEQRLRQTIKILGRNFGE